MIDFNFEKECYGCGACANICPVNAIIMKENKEGFLMPYVDKEKCIKCNKCVKICPRLNQNKVEKPFLERDYYAFFNKNVQERSKSTSGGVFWLLAKKFIEDGNYIAGAVWKNPLKVEHIVTNDIEEVQRMRESKYIQSEVGNVYNEIKSILKQNKKVLFSGTPCQCNAIINITNNHENLYTAAVICEGVPSPKMWRWYCQYIEEKEGKKIKKVTMRSKDGENKWKEPHYKFEFTNGESILIKNTEVSYFLAFVTGLMQRKSCYRCGVKCDNINSDIIMGDYWGCDKQKLEKSEKNGISVLGVNTKKGELMKKWIESEAYCENADIQHILKRNKVMITSIKKSPNRNRFFRKVKEENIDKILMKYQGRNLIKNRIIKITKKIGIYTVLKKVVKKGER